MAAARLPCFFVDLPNQQEREAIWRIQIAKFGRAPKQFDLVQLSKATEGLTGSEIEQLFVDALYAGFNRREEPTDLSIALLLNDLVPLSKLMSEQIGELRKWAKGRARPATAAKAERAERKRGCQCSRVRIARVWATNQSNSLTCARLCGCCGESNLNVARAAGCRRGAWQQGPGEANPPRGGAQFSEESPLLFSWPGVKKTGVVLNE